MSDPAARAIASIALCLAATGIAWAAPDSAFIVVIGLALGIRHIWDRAA
jgi:hypothetical protein